MSNFQDTLAELFNDKLNFEYIGQSLPTPEIDGNENIINYTKEYEGLGTVIILVECKDRIIEFQKKLIKNQKALFPTAHFLFVSNGGKVFDLYNNTSSKKLKKISYDEIGRNTRLFKEKLQLFDVTQANDGTDLQINAERAFDTSDKITKKFFDKFKKIHEKLQKAITGIEDEKDKSWYASVMMNRIMFIYFLQKHYVIQGNTSFLLDKFDEIAKGKKDYYSDFLLPLFFYGFARRDNNPSKQKFVAEYGSIRYLNGGLFYPHHIEKKYTIENAVAGISEEKALQTKIGINPPLIREILEFLDGYTWYLDNRPMKEDTDINPDVLGYIFEKYINQKELGAYYTKEDITEYISKNTIIPFIFDKMKNNGFKVPDPNPMITNNEDIINQMGLYIDGIKDYKEIKFLYKNVLLELSVLDPSVGSGAFLFAALNILLPIYQKSVFKLKQFSKTEKDSWLNETITSLSNHSEEYFLTKQIILNNLYGVDIVEEATEICKLRLFLQLASHLPDITSIEPLPDIDFNIYAGNSLVGGLSWEDLEANYTMDLFTSANRDNIKIDITTLSDLKTQYRAIQQQDDNEGELSLLKDNISTLEHRVNTDIKIGIKNPFHWFIDFNNILEKGGFDIIIGNPPYVEYSKIKKQYELINYQTIKSSNLYSLFIERAHRILNENSKLSFITQASLICTDRMLDIQNFIKNHFSDTWVSSFCVRPNKLFDGAEIRTAIIITSKNKNEGSLFTSKYNRWISADRETLFKKILYFKLNDIKYQGTIPKLASETQKSLYDKLIKLEDFESCFSSNKTDKEIYYHNTPRYWIRSTTFKPYFFNDKDGEKLSTQIKTLNIKKEYYWLALGIINSSLFYWWFIINSDGFHLNNRELNYFPIKGAPSNELNIKLEKILKKLMDDYKKNAIRKSTYYKTTGNVIYDEFKPKLSYNIIKELDDVIFEYYGLDLNEKLEISNYDIELRLGEQDEEIEE